MAEVLRKKSEELWIEIQKQKEHFLARGTHHVHYSRAFRNWQDNFQLDEVLNQSVELEAPGDDVQVQEVPMTPQKPIINNVKVSNQDDDFSFGK